MHSTTFTKTAQTPIRILEKKNALDLLVETLHNQSMNLLKATTVIALSMHVCLSSLHAQENPENILPDIERGRKAYQENCVSCHGMRGTADTAIAQSLATAPRSFADPKVQEKLNPLRAFEAVTQGVPASGMPPFHHLTKQERWDIAAYLFTMRMDFSMPTEPWPTMAWWESKTMSDIEIIDVLRKRGVPEKYIKKELNIIRFYPE
jgi:cytochrome c